MTIQAGGRITITMGGVRYSPRGKAMINPAGLTHSVIANQDGKISRTTMAQPVTAELTFDRGEAEGGFERPKWGSDFMSGFYDITLRETDARVTHHFFGATIVGTPSIDTESGEVTGLSIATSEQNYTQTNG
jgi:hypothetical protein